VQVGENQGFGSGSGSGFSDFLDPDPFWESGSRIRIQGQENKEISVEKCTFSYIKKIITKKV
jgi:hypothetical protein